MATLDQKDISNVEIIIANLASQVKIIKNLWDQRGTSVSTSGQSFTNLADYDNTNTLNEVLKEDFLELLRLLINKTNKGATVIQDTDAGFTILDVNGDSLGTALSDSDAGTYTITGVTDKTFNVTINEATKITFPADHKLKENDVIEITSILDGGANTATLTYYKINNILPNINSFIATIPAKPIITGMTPDYAIKNDDTQIPVANNAFGVLTDATTFNGSFGSAATDNPDLSYLRNLLLVITDLIFQNIIFNVNDVDGSNDITTTGSGRWSNDLRDIAESVSRDQDTSPFTPLGGILNNAATDLKISKTPNMEYHLFRVIKALVQMVGKLDLTNSTDFEKNLQPLKQLDGSTLGTEDGLMAGESSYSAFASEGLDEFSADLNAVIKNFFKRVKDLTNELKAYATNNINSTNNTIGFDIADIGIGGIIKNIGLSLMNILLKIAMFPKAIAMGAVAALKAAMPGGASPMEAFSERFNAVMSGVDGAIDNMKMKSDGLDEEGNIIQGLSEEGRALQDQREFEGTIRGRVVSMFKGGDKGGDTTLITDGGFGSRIKNRFSQFGNRYTDDD